MFHFVLFCLFLFFFLFCSIFSFLFWLLNFVPFCSILYHFQTKMSAHNSWTHWGTRENYGNDKLSSSTFIICDQARAIKRREYNYKYPGQRWVLKLLILLYCCIVSWIKTRKKSFINIFVPKVQNINYMEKSQLVSWAFCTM